MRVTINGRGFGVEKLGESGPRVVLIMGFGMSRIGWFPQVDDLKCDHQLLTFDNRGTGESDPVDDPYTLDDLADDTVGLMDHVDWPDAHVVGVSMGGMVAQHLALRHRERVKSLTLIATSPGPANLLLPTIEGLKQFAKANTSTDEARLRALLNLLIPPPFHSRVEADPRWHTFKSDFLNPIPRKTMVMQLRAVALHNTAKDLRQLSGLPTLVIRPDSDVLIRPSNSDRLVDSITGARLLTFPEAGHGVGFQCAEEVNAHLRAHIAAKESRI